MPRDANGASVSGHAAASEPQSTTDDPPPVARPRWKDAIRTFSPAWFTPTMGTAVTATLLHRLPYPTPWLHWPTILLLALSVVLFALAALLLAARLVLWPGEWGALRRDGAQLWFLGAAPIGLGSVVNMVVYVCVEAWGGWAAKMAWGLWMVNVVLAVGIAFLVPFLSMTSGSPRGLPSITTTQLMPLAGPLAAALTGSTVARVLAPPHALWTIVTSYALWGLGMLGSTMTLAAWYQRLLLCGLPPRESMPAMFLPIAPLCLGALSILQLGKAARSLPTTLLGADEAAIPAVLGVLVALALWGAAILWLAYAVAAALYAAPLPFHVGWWEFTFPPGMLALTTIVLGDELSAEFFTVLGTIFAVAETLLWIVVALGTAWCLATGRPLDGSGASWHESGRKGMLRARRKRDEEA